MFATKYLLLCSVLLVAACGGNPPAETGSTPQPSLSPAPEPSVTPEPTTAASPEPGSAPEPTLLPTIEPTTTPIPSAAPTATPSPTPTTAPHPEAEGGFTEDEADFIVSNASELEQALEASFGGVIILLNDGDYGELNISKQFNNHVIISAKNQSRASFSKISINGDTKGFVHFDRIAANGFDIRNHAHHIKISRSRIANTVYFRWANNIVLENNIIDVEGNFHAIVMNYVSQFTVRENFIGFAQEDLLRITGDSAQGVIENNVLYDTLPQNQPSASNACAYNHTDALQMFGANNVNPRDIVIRGNFFYDDPLNNDIRPEACTPGRPGTRLTMQGIFLSDPQDNGYQHILVEQNFMQVGSANTIYINGATENVTVRNNTLLPWQSGGGGSFRIVEKAGVSNRGLELYNNVAKEYGDQTSALSNGMQIYGNYQYDFNNSNAVDFIGNIFAGGGAGSTWQDFLHVTGSPIDFSNNLGAATRLMELQNGNASIPTRDAF